MFNLEWYQNIMLLSRIRNNTDIFFPVSLLFVHCEVIEIL